MPCLSYYAHRAWTQRQDGRHRGHSIVHRIAIAGDTLPCNAIFPAIPNGERRAYSGRDNPPPRRCRQKAVEACRHRKLLRSYACKTQSGIHATCALEIPVEVSSLGCGQAIRRQGRNRHDPPPCRGFHTYASCPGKSAKRRQADSMARPSSIRRPACHRDLLQRMSREMVESSKGNGYPARPPIPHRRLPNGLDRTRTWIAHLDAT